ncbi:ComF family protein [Sphingomonas immobilis]|uniref:ComF family protein n=1 Tax=Sphingomonas immobilis TaxID=3063997 RepID=A0ABT8ZXJ4_9SPHN|nr:ComF family protein [Sphingomonas sp. CA1-15]MDO7841207.1 ComF family protein [Sphingomonas sp. CA1-15]
MLRLLSPLHFVAGLALPPRCPGCGAVTGEDHRFCAACWGSLRFLAPPWCAGCHVPFDHDMGDDARCAACSADPPRHDGVLAAVAYGDVARTVALRLKYGGRIAFAETVARQMARLLPDGADLLLPVPLHRWRLWSRGFNQAALIAAAMARSSGIAHDPVALVRRRATPVLRGLGAKARKRAVKGVFGVAHPDRVKGRTVALIDDIYTSGATTDACTAALLRAGAASVTILCWARVLDEGASD